MNNALSQSEKIIWRSIVSVLICAVVLLLPFRAYALNADMVENEVYWIDKGKEIYYSGDDYFEGFSKYIADEAEGCFYLFTRFTDYRIDNNDDNITFAFTIANDVNTYHFAVDKNGFTDATSPNTAQEIDVYYNFDESSCKRQGGGVYIAFALKNKTDKMLNNRIDCEYSCGYSRTYDIFNNVRLNMYVPTTARTTKNTSVSNGTTAHKSKTDFSTRIKQTQNSEKSANSKRQSQKSTKFCASGKESFTEAQKKRTANFSGENSKHANHIGENETENGSFNVLEKSDEQSKVYSIEKRKELSTQAKLLLIIFSILFIVGVICVIIGTVHNKNEDKNYKEDH